jgi:hypothetical protein
MNPDGLKAFLRLGVFIVVASVCMIGFQTPGTPTFVVTILSMLIGAALIALVWWVGTRE